MQSQGSQVENLGINLLNLLDVEAVADLSFLLDDLSQLLKQGHSGCEQFSDGWGRILATSVNVVRISENDEISVDEDIHSELLEQERYLFQYL